MLEDFIQEQFIALKLEIEFLKDKIQMTQTSGLDFETFDNKALSKIFGLSDRTLFEYRKNRIIGFVKIGSRIFYTRKQVEEFLQMHKINSKLKTLYNGRL